MNHQPEKIIVTSMNPRTMSNWSKRKRKKRISLRSVAVLSAAVFSLTVGTYALTKNDLQTDSVMSVMSTGFEYDETLGRLQYVSNILPESAMVFLSNETKMPSFVSPSETDNVLHGWSQEEPWIEYERAGNIRACEGGEIMTIVKNRGDEYTVRLLHDGGYESIYSGLTGVLFEENERIESGELIGSAEGNVSFEIRKDGLSVLPVFSRSDGM